MWNPVIYYETYLCRILPYNTYQHNSESLPVHKLLRVEYDESVWKLKGNSTQTWIRNFSDKRISLYSSDIKSPIRANYLKLCCKSPRLHYDFMMTLLVYLEAMVCIFWPVIIYICLLLYTGFLTTHCSSIKTCSCHFILYSY